MTVNITNSRTFACFLCGVILLTAAAPPVWMHCHQDCSAQCDECCGAQQELPADGGACCWDRAALGKVESKHQHSAVGWRCWKISCNRDVSHYHIEWLGLAARVPVDKQSQQFDDQGELPAILHKVKLSLNKPGLSSCIERYVNRESGLVTGYVFPQCRDRADLPPDALLCDSVRHERTGVLVV